MRRRRAPHPGEHVLRVLRCHIFGLEESFRGLLQRLALHHIQRPHGFDALSRLGVQLVDLGCRKRNTPVILVPAAESLKAALCTLLFEVMDTWRWVEPSLVTHLTQIAAGPVNAVLKPLTWPDAALKCEPAGQNGRTSVHSVSITVSLH